jgi:hypothetical protein
MALAVMVQCAAIFQGNPDHRLLCSSSCLVNGFRHFARLAMPKAYAPLAIAAATVLPRRVLGDSRPIEQLLVGLPLQETLRWSRDATGLLWQRAA